jgi:predicted transcriptional regulator
MRHLRIQTVPPRRHSILLPATRFFRILKGMEVHFNSNLEARLTERATQQGRKPDEFVQNVAASCLDEEDRFVQAVKRGEDALERGEYLTHDQVGERLRRITL